MKSSSQVQISASSVAFIFTLLSSGKDRIHLIFLKQWVTRQCKLEPLALICNPLRKRTILNSNPYPESLRQSDIVFYSGNFLTTSVPRCIGLYWRGKTCCMSNCRSLIKKENPAQAYVLKRSSDFGCRSMAYRDRQMP